MTRVLITGASGFIGSGVLEYLLEHTGWDFTAICSWRHHGNPLNIAPQERVTVITHDLCGPIPEIGDFDYILNLASESHVDRSIADPVNFIENNVSSTLQVLEYARKHQPKVFIQFSTDEVFGAMEHEEWDILLPSNPYAASKAAQEMIAIAYWKTYGVPVVITNSNNIVGKNQDPEKFVPKLVKKLKASEQIEIHTHNGTPGSRHYNPVQNVADALLFILQRDPAMYSPDVIVATPDRYSLPGGQELDNLQMAHIIAGKLGIKNLSYKLVDAETVRRGYDQFYPKTDGRLTKLGWNPPMTLEEGLEWIQ
jgi:dTDP-glucose 4,6-dehydratase